VLKPIAVAVRKLSVYLQPFRRDFYGGYHSLMPSCAGFLNLENRDLDRRNLRSMQEILYAVSSCLFQLVSVQFAFEMCLAAQYCQKIRKNSYFSIQDHPRSLNSVAIESQLRLFVSD